MRLANHWVSRPRSVPETLFSADNETWSAGPRQEENCSAGGGGGIRKPIFPTPPPSLAAVTGGVQGRGARPAVPGGGGVNPTFMAQNDTHVVLIILTTQMWGGGDYWWKKTFSGQNLCSCAFGANIRSYTKQRAQHRTPFLQPPNPPSFGGP